MFDIVLTQYGGSFLGPIAKVLGFILRAIYDFLGNFGIENAAISIILFTFIVNLLMLPLTVKQQKYSKMSSRMQPELLKITEKYKGKKDNASMLAQQEETKALYEKYGVSPTGGCLPTIITLFVFMALYKVIYAIPAYVPQIKEIYMQVAEIAQGNKEAIQYIADSCSRLGVTTSGWGENIKQALSSNTNYIIDVFTKFGTSEWSGLAAIFTGEQAAQITTISERIMHVNGIFGGLNIAETPVTKPFPGIIIPIVSVILQYIQTHLLSANTQMDPENPAAASMKIMNWIMPLMSGVFCLFFPIGAGIYLVASSLFRIIQQFFVNRYMEHMDVDSMIDKNMEKARLKREKLHLEASDGSIKNVANIRTNTMSEIANMNTNKGKKSQENTDSNNVSYEKGSISSIAHMLDKSNKK